MKTSINTRSTKDQKSYCHTYRDAGIDVEKAQPEEWARAGVARDAVRHYRLNPSSSEGDIETFIEREMLKLPALSPVTLEAQKAQVRNIVMRCISYDKRHWKEGFRKSFRFGGEILEVRPDYWLETDITIDGKTYPLIEVNTLSAGKPRFGTTTRTSKADSLYHNLTTCGDLLFGKAMLRGREGLVRVEYDFLKTSADKNSDYSKPFSEAKKADTFTKSGSDNRAWIEVWFSPRGHIVPRDRNGYNARIPKIFGNYRVSLEEYLNGCCEEELKKSTCEKCELYDRCRGYSKRPEPKPEQRTSGKKMTRDDFDISDEQRAVIGARNGIYCVDAGPGSGKTFSVALRIADMIVDGAAPEDFLLISFSRAAVAVMKQRVDFFLNEVYMMDIDVSAMKIATFNSIGDELVRKYYWMLGFTEEPRLIDDVENIDIIRRAVDWEDPLEGFDYTNPLMRFGTGGVVPKLEKIFGEIRQFNRDRASFIKNYSGNEPDRVWETYERYTAIMKEENFIDYSDQSNVVEKLIHTDQTLVTDMFNYEHIVVDEFQDSNDFQMLLINTLSLAPDNLSLMVVGDEGQAIYGFRGTSPENLVEFDNRMGLGGVRDLSLTINRRSTPEIVELSNQVINLNRGDHKVMRSINPSGPLPRWKAFKKDTEELPWVADEIEGLVKCGTAPSDIAFISHKKSTLTKLQGLLSERGILALFDQPEEIISDSRVRAILSLAAFLRDGRSTKGVLDYLCEVYGNSFLMDPDVNETVRWEAHNLEKIFSLPADDASKKKMFLNLVRAIDDGTDNLYRAFIERLEGKKNYNSFQLLNYIYKFEKYESEETAEKGGEYEAVSLVTAHSCKGKEWKKVFVSLSDFDSGMLTYAEMPEKVRLSYVAVTRAEEYLTVTCSKYRRTEGDIRPVNRFYRMFSTLPGFEDITPSPEELSAHGKKVS